MYLVMFGIVIVLCTIKRHLGH